MTPRRRKVLVATVIALFVALVGGLAAAFLEFEEYEADIGYRGEARRNPLLAAERTLRGLGHDVESLPVLGPLPPKEALLVLRQSSRFLSPFDVERLLAWIAEGGHLVLLLPGQAEFAEQIEDDVEEGRLRLPLLEALDLGVRIGNDFESETELDLGFGPRRLAIDSRLSLEDPYGLADVVAGSPMEARALGIAHEAGRATVFADDEWALNDGLGELGHPHVLAELAQLGGERREVLLVYGERPPGLLNLLWTHGWTVVCALAALVALALWRRGFSLGPRLPELARDRRDFSEHVVATGEFLWRVGASAKLLAAPHAELRRRLALVRPDLAELAPAARAQALAEASGLELERVKLALATEDTRDPTRFMAVVRDLETIRRSL